MIWRSRTSGEQWIVSVRRREAVGPVYYGHLRLAWRAALREYPTPRADRRADYRALVALDDMGRA